MTTTPGVIVADNFVPTPEFIETSFNYPRGSISRISSPHLVDDDLERYFIQDNTLDAKQCAFAHSRMPSMPTEYNNCVEHHAGLSQIFIRFR